MYIFYKNNIINVDNVTQITSYSLNVDKYIFYIAIYYNSTEKDRIVMQFEREDESNIVFKRIQDAIRNNLNVLEIE